MQYILFLNKFSISLEKLEKKIKDLLKDASIEKEDNHLILTTNSDVNRIISFDEISKITEIKVPFTHLKTFEDFRKVLLNNLDKKYKTFAVVTKFITNIPISKRSIYKRINSLLKKESMQYEEDSPELSVIAAPVIALGWVRSTFTVIGSLSSYFPTTSTTLNL